MLGRELSIGKEVALRFCKELSDGEVWPLEHRDGLIEPGTHQLPLRAGHEITEEDGPERFRLGIPYLKAEGLSAPVGGHTDRDDENL